MHSSLALAALSTPKSHRTLFAGERADHGFMKKRTGYGQSAFLLFME